MNKKVVALLLGMSLMVSGSSWATSYSQGEEFKADTKVVVQGKHQLEYGRFGLQRELEKKYEKDNILGSSIEIYDKNSDGAVISVGKVKLLGSQVDSDYIYMPNEVDPMYGKICNGKAEIIVSDIKSYWLTDDGRLVRYTDKDGKDGIYDTINRKVLNIDSYKFDEKSYANYQNVDGESYLIIVEGESKKRESFKNGEEYSVKVTVLNIDTMKSINTVISASYKDELSIKKLSKEKNIMLLLCVDHRRNLRYEKTVIINPDGEARLLEFDGYEFDSLYGPSGSYGVYGENDIDNVTIVYRKEIEDYASKYIFYLPETDKVVDLKGTYRFIRPFDEGKLLVKTKGNDNTIVLDESENILEVLDYEHYFYNVLLDEKTNKEVYVSNYRYAYSSDYSYTVNIFTDGEHTRFKLDMHEPDTIINKIVDGVVYYDHCRFNPVKDKDGNVTYEKEKFEVENFENLSKYAKKEVEGSSNFIFTYYDVINYNCGGDFLIISNKLGETILKVDEFYDYNYVKEINKNAIAYEQNGKDHIYFLKEKKDVEFERDIIAYSKDLTLKDIDSVLSIMYDNGDYIIDDNKDKKRYPKFAADSIRKVNDDLYFYESNDDYYGIIKVKEDGSVEINDPIYTSIDTLKSSDKLIVKNMIGLLGVLNQDGTELIKPEFDNIEYVTDELFITKEDNKNMLHRIVK
jgi:hypothetical protein